MENHETEFKATGELSHLVPENASGNGSVGGWAHYGLKTKVRKRGGASLEAASHSDSKE